MTPLISTSYHRLNLAGGTPWLRDLASKEVRRVRIKTALDSLILATITALFVRIIDNGSMPVAILAARYLFVAAYVARQLALVASLGSAMSSIKKKVKNENLFLIPKRSDPEHATTLELLRKSALTSYATQAISVAIFTLFSPTDGTTLGLGILYQGLHLVSLYNRLGIILDPESWENVRFLETRPVKGRNANYIFIASLAPITEDSII